MSQPLSSRICRGRVMHRRLRPAGNRFDYPVFFLKLRLAELESLSSRWFGINRWAPLSLRYADYGKRDGSDPRRAKSAVQQAVSRIAVLPGGRAIPLRCQQRAGAGAGGD